MTDENQPTEEPKIIVDEDWKTQVEREKEELKKKEAEGDESPANDADGDDQSMPLPPASFTVLLSTLATQALSGLGVFPDPMTGEAKSNLPLAKHFIDTIGMLEEKTQGNLSDDEAKQVEETLHQLRMAFMAVKDQPVDSPEPKKSTIELP